MYVYQSVLTPVATETTSSEAARLAVAPNPAVGQASLSYSLATPERVRLSVYDALGREVARVVDAERPTGEHRARLDTGRLSAGIYVVRLEAGGQVSSRTLTVVR